MSNRAQIMADLQAVLQSITGVAEVRRGLHMDDDMPARPALCLAGQKRSCRDFSSGQAEAKLFVVIAGYVDCPAADYSALDGLAADLEAALMDSARNPWWADTHIGDLLVYEGGASDPIGILNLEITVDYEYQRGEP